MQTVALVEIKHLSVSTFKRFLFDKLLVVCLLTIGIRLSYHLRINIITGICFELVNDFHDIMMERKMQLSPKIILRKKSGLEGV